MIRVLCYLLSGVFFPFTTYGALSWGAIPLKTTPFYAPLSKLCPTQIRISKKNVDEKVEKGIKKGDIIKGDDTTYKLTHDHGKSCFSLKEAIPVIKTPFAYYLCDGHHGVLASIKVNAETMPINIIDNWDGDIDDDFWKWAMERGYAYLYLSGGIEKKIPQNFNDLVDDPLRYFAAMTARKYEDMENLDHAHSSGAEYPLWIKIGKELFSEFKIADCLQKAGFTYQYGDEKKDTFFKQVEEARAILAKAKLPHIKVVVSYEKYDKSEQIQNWLCK